MGTIFLSAEWRHLAMLNFAVDPALLRARVPRGTRLDLWQGQALVSIVGFMFYNTRVLGAPIPFHTTFEELNLRFYIVREHPSGDRRGVCFIKEIVRRPAVSFIARTLYNENYMTLPMRHSIESSAGKMCVRYQWRTNGHWRGIRCVASGEPAVPALGSEAAFITEHYWGYAAQRSGMTREYHVVHPSWRVWERCDYSIDADFAALYGKEFAAYLDKQPVSALIAEGSPITVSRGVLLPR